MIEQFMKKINRYLVSSSEITVHHPPIYHQCSFSQEGEDMILNRIFNGKKNGCYIDIGAFHPQELSNTYFFYLLGWQGINIDARPGSMQIFKKIRPKDINLEIAISQKEEELIYYGFNYSNLNGFSDRISRERNGWRIGEQWEAKIISETKLKTYPLSKVLEKHLLDKQEIDFMNIDVEGLDYEVLKSNNWDKYRPNLILIEDLETSSISKLENSNIYLFMQEQKYELYCKTVHTFIYKSTGFNVSI